MCARYRLKNLVEDPGCMLLSISNSGEARVCNLQEVFNARTFSRRDSAIRGKARNTTHVCDDFQKKVIESG